MSRKNNKNNADGTPAETAVTRECWCRHANETRSKIAVMINAAAMAVVIFFGWWTHSMALLADGWHMASHVFTLALAWLAYWVARKFSNTARHRFDRDKLMSLSGFLSAVSLLVVAVLVLVESVSRLLDPMEIQFREAVCVAAFGFAVNLACAFVLHGGHDDDHNIRVAYFHVLADVVTSVAAMIALAVGFLWRVNWLDCVAGIVGAAIIAHWAVSLMWSAGRALVDYQPLAGPGRGEA